VLGKEASVMDYEIPAYVIVAIVAALCGLLGFALLYAAHP
jgi:hypothetical protein